MSTRFKTLTNRTVTLGVGIPQAFPIQLDPAPFEGAIVYADNGELRYSDGTAWLQISGGGAQAVGPQGATGIQGSQGVQGDYGPGFTIIGSVADVDTTGDPDAYLKAQFPGANIGEGVIDETDQELWIYDGTNWINIGSFRGEQGLQGVQGFQGVQGQLGQEGIQGTRGFRGFQGLQGVQGIQGVQGYRGFQGFQGFRGPQGVQGTQGFQGVQGPQGPQGTQGVQGPQGPQGTQGFQGVQGVQGQDGKFAGQGVQGPQGPQGLQGVQGPQGPQGTTGFQGVQGVQGTQGVRGDFGGVSFEYAFVNDQAASDPGVQNFKYNNADAGLSTEIYIDDVAGPSGTNVSFFYNSLDNVTGPTKGYLRIVLRSDNTKFLLYRITEITDNTGWFTFNVQYVAGSASSANLISSPDVVVTFSQAGEQGIQGTTGSQGVQGIQGFEGFYGGLTFQWELNRTSGDAFPGVGRFGLVDAGGAASGDDVYDVTKIWFDDKPYDANRRVDDIFNYLDRNPQTPKGQVVIRTPRDTTTNDFEFIIYEINNWTWAGSGGSEDNGWFDVTFIEKSLLGPSGANTVSWFDATNRYGDVAVISFLPAGPTGLQGIQGVQGTQGFQGAQGTQGSQGVQGPQGVQGVQGNQGVQGAQGRTGETGIQGAQGPRGLQGVQGHIGNYGGLTYEWNFANNQVASTDPGVSQWKINSSDVRTANTLTIDDLPTDNYLLRIDEIFDWLDSIPGSSKGLIVIESDADDDGPPGHHQVVYEFSNWTWDSVAKAWGWFDISYVGSYGLGLTYNWNDSVLGSGHGPKTVINFVPRGDAGIQGVQGTLGIQGPQGVQGLQGPQGPQGVQGDLGIQGVQGLQGQEGSRVYNVTNNGNIAYVIDTVNNPTLRLLRGFTYSFDINASGHPFYIKTARSLGTGNQYTAGVTGNGTQVGLLTFRVPFNAPATLYYQCEFHSGMGGTIEISDLGPRGPQGVQGTQGFQGIQGPGGSFGGASFEFDFNDTFNAADPGIGRVKLNNNNASSATQMYIDERDIGFVLLDDYFSSLDAVTGSIKGQFKIISKSNPTLFHVYEYSDLTDSSGYWTFAINSLGGSAAGWNDGDDVIITFARAGQQGADGSAGAQGTTGSQGAGGIQGVQGDAIQGSIGPQGIQGFRGIQGLPGSGTQGLQGVQGTQGYRGFQGRTGFQGPGGAGAQGIQGIQGPQGVQGRTGAGAQGIQGIQGRTGSQGVQGPQGPTAQGAGGLPGPPGPQGIQGPQGHQGTQGIQGPPGGGGTQGIQGGFGPQGTAGFVGGAGIQGVQGPQGIQGDLGEGGLQGGRGPQGVQGERGAGDQGSPGVQGPRGFQGPEGQGVVGGAGLQGPRGFQGPQGEDGAQGSSGGLSAQGPAGPQGPEGGPGIQGGVGTGIQGPRGFQGDYGPQGTRGPEGGLSAQGQVGPQGAQGDYGIQGIQGPAGQSIVGAQGYYGIQGTQGYRGFQGPTGPGSAASTLDVQNIYGSGLEASSMFVTFVAGGSGARSIYGTLGPNTGGEQNFFYQASADSLYLENITADGNITALGTFIGLIQDPSGRTLTIRDATGTIIWGA